MAAEYSYKVWEHFAHYANPFWTESSLNFLLAVQTLAGISFRGLDPWDPSHWVRIAIPAISPYRVVCCSHMDPLWVLTRRGGCIVAILCNPHTREEIGSTL